MKLPILSGVSVATQSVVAAPPFGSRGPSPDSRATNQARDRVGADRSEEPMRTQFLLALACACAAAPSTRRTDSAAASAIAGAAGPAAPAQIEPRSGSALSGTAK